MPRLSNRDRALAAAPGTPPAPPDPATPPAPDPAKGVPDPAPGTTWVYAGHVADVAPDA